jgi:hypothetical protein
MADNQKVLAGLVMDRGTPLGNTVGSDGRGKLHTLSVTSLVDYGWGWFTVAYPSSIQEVYTFYPDSSMATVLGQVVLNYTDATKTDLASGGAL